MPNARCQNRRQTAPHRTAPHRTRSSNGIPSSPSLPPFPFLPFFPAPPSPSHIPHPPYTDPPVARSHPPPPPSPPRVAAAFVAAQDISRRFFARPRFCFSFVFFCGGEGRWYSVCRVGLSWMLFGIRDDAHDGARRGEVGALGTGGRTGGRKGRRVRCEL